MSHSPLELLQHILDEIDFLLTESASIDESSFENDEKSKRAWHVGSLAHTNYQKIT